MKDRLFDNLRAAASALAAAARAGSAVESGLRPRRRDLDALGIDPGAFRKIRR